MIKNQQLMKFKQMIKHIILFLFFLSIVFANSIYSQSTIKILDKKKKIYINSTKNNDRLSLKIFHDYDKDKEEIDTNAYDVNIIDKNGKKIRYKTMRKGGGISRESFSAFATKKLEISIKEKHTTIFLPLTKYYVWGRDSEIHRLDVKKGKYYLYVSYQTEETTYYSDTIPLKVSERLDFHPSNLLLPFRKLEYQLKKKKYEKINSLQISP